MLDTPGDRAYLLDMPTPTKTAKPFADLNAALAANNPAAIAAATAAIQAQVDALKAAGLRDMPPVGP